MAATLRQEINITCNSSGGASGVVLGADGIISIDKTQYNGTLAIYFEANISTLHAANTLTLRRIGTTTDDGSVSVAATGLVRTANIAASVPATATEYGIYSASTTVRVKNARVIIIQTATTLTNTETQIEIGNASATTTTTDTALTNPKYWYYNSANWDGTLTAYFESTFLTATSKSAATMTLQVADGTGDGFAGWANVTNTAITTTSTTAARVRSAAITLTADRWYRAVMKAGNSKSGITIYRAGIVIDQNYGASIVHDSSGWLSVQGGTAGAGQTNQAGAQSFKLDIGDTITGVDVSLAKQGSPTDTLLVDLVSTQTGAALATGNIAGTSLTTSFVIYTITFAVPFTVTANTTYYLRFQRSPDTNDITNYFKIESGNSLSSPGPYPNGTNSTRSNNSWADGAVNQDVYFVLKGITGITKLEPQYLLANTLLAAGTSLQTFLTKYDSTEWDDGAGTTTFTGQAEAANGSTSDVLIQEADAGSTVATINNPDNAGTAAATMPTSQNLDCLANTNAGDVAAVRLLVAYVFSAAATSAIKTINGLAIASVSKINGLARASMKNFNGLA